MGYTKGLHDVGNGCWAYLQPEGGWGWSNAGLIDGDGVSLLVDTLFDLPLTREMLASMRGVTDRSPIATAVNTHANGDHCYGNAELDRGVEIVATAAAAHEMTEVPPSTLAAMTSAEGEVGDLFRHFFGAFQFEGIEQVLPSRTFSGRLDLDVGHRRVELVEVGPAHTNGDLLVFVPDAGVVYTGDILFSQGTPIAWAGPLSNWVAAFDVILGSDAMVVVPGHGPIADRATVAEAREYLVFVEDEARQRFDAGVDAWDAARDIARLLGTDGRHFDRWGEAARLSVNVDTAYRSFDPTHVRAGGIDGFRRMVSLDT
jgi:cyclase